MIWNVNNFGKELGSERVEAAYIARAIFVIYNYSTYKAAFHFYW